MNVTQRYLLEIIKDHPRDAVRVAMDRFEVTRAAVLFHLKKLKDSGQVVQHGERNKTRYYLNDDLEAVSITSLKEFQYRVGSAGEDQIWKSDIKPLLSHLPQNILDILQYSFTEMFNNVIDHSGSSGAQVRITTDPCIKIEIIDHGIGVFKNIATFFGVTDFREALIQLHQGKVTTDSSRHSGQGIYFTSKAVDEFVLKANGLMYLKNNLTDDWYWERYAEVQAGTSVLLTLDRGSKRLIKDVFDYYTDKDLHFDKSHLRIELSKFEEESFISRSQAKRLLAGCHDFSVLLLDFKNVRNVGQAFVDEVFGVYGEQFPQVRFEIINANEDVIFMIRRGLLDRKIPIDKVNIF